MGIDQVSQFQVIQYSIYLEEWGNNDEMNPRKETKPTCNALKWNISLDSSGPPFKLIVFKESSCKSAPPD